MKIVIIIEISKCCIENFKPKRNIMSVPTFLYKLEFVFNNNQSDGYSRQ